MQTLLTVLIVLGAALGQALIGPLRIAGEMPPPLMAGAVLFYALNRPVQEGLLVAFLTGLLHDSIGLVPLGYSSVLFCVAVVVTSRFRRSLITESVLTGAVFGCGMVVVVQAVTAMLLIRNGLLNGPGFGAVIWKIAGSGMLAVVFIPLLFGLAAAAHGAIAPEQTKDRSNGRVSTI